MLDVSSYDRLILLGSGAQYNVYDLDNGKVFKRPKSFKDVLATLSRWGIYKRSELHTRATELIERRDFGSEYIKLLIDKKPNSAVLFGYPEFFEDKSFKQAKLTTLESLFRQSSFRDCRKLIDQYVDLVVNLLEYGLLDFTFNFAVNYGVEVSDDNRIVLFDFGEISTNKLAIARIIDKRAWEFSFDLNHRLSPLLKEYFLKAMKFQITQSRLDKHWKLAFK